MGFLWLLNFSGPLATSVYSCELEGCQLYAVSLLHCGIVFFTFTVATSPSSLVCKHVFVNATSSELGSFHLLERLFVLAESLGA